MTILSHSLDADLFRLYRWATDLIPAALGRLRLAASQGRPDSTLQGPSRIVTIGLLRGVIGIQRQGKGLQTLSHYHGTFFFLSVRRYKRVHEAWRIFLATVGLA